MLKKKSFRKSRTRLGKSSSELARSNTKKHTEQPITKRTVLVLKAKLQGATRVLPPVSREKVYFSPYEEVAGPPVDIALVRRNVNKMIWVSVQKIAAQLIEAAEDGQLAAARYLFEAVGLYPSTEQKKESPVEESLPYALLKRIAAAEAGSEQ
jgi:hypothetical protein